MQNGRSLRCLHLWTQSSCLAVAALLTAGISFAAATAQGPASAKAVVSLCSISFAGSQSSSASMSHADKACLDDVALNLQKSPEANLAIIGNARKSEKSPALVAARRAATVKKYLVLEKGIAVNRITLYTGHQDGMTVAINLVPPHAVLDASIMVPVNESKLK